MVATGKKPAKRAREQTRRVILYCGSDLSRQENSFFFLNLFWKLMMLGQERGYEMIPIMDNRPANRIELIPKEAEKRIREGRADGVIGFMIYASMAGWMQDSGLPYSVLLNGESAHHVNFDYCQMADISLARLAEAKCRSVGWMLPSQLTNSGLLDHLEEAAKGYDLKVNYEWIQAPRKTHEFNGAACFSSLWELKNRPDGLVVFPDVMARGVITGILQKQVKVPDELRLILHRNEENPYSVPVPCDWLENSGLLLAEALIGQIEAQWDGRPLKKQKVPFRIVRGS